MEWFVLGILTCMVGYILYKIYRSEQYRAEKLDEMDKKLDRIQERLKGMN